MAMEKPRLRSAASRSRISPPRAALTPSVISSSIRARSTPRAAQQKSRYSTKSGSSRFFGETLTASDRSRPSRAQIAACRVAASIDPAGHRGDERGLLGELDELAGRDRAELRVGPAQQRLGADAGAGVERHLRLVVQLELALGVERVLEVGEEPEGAAVRLVALAVEPRPAGARAAAVLRRRERGAQVLAGAAAAERLEPDADAGVDRHVVAEDRLGGTPRRSASIIAGGSGSAWPGRRKAKLRMLTW